MKYCHICGTPIEDDSLTSCPNCGRKQHSFRRPDGVVIDPYRMQLKKSEPTPVVAPSPAIEEPVKEEPTSIVEKEVVKQENIAANPVKKPAKRKKGMFIGIVAASVGVLAIGVVGIIVVPKMLGGTRGGETSLNGGNTGSKTGTALANKDPIGTWAYSNEASLFYTFEDDGTAKYWQINSSTNNLDFLYYGYWTRNGCDVTAKYELYFNSGVMYTDYKLDFIVYEDRIEKDGGGKYYSIDKEAPYVDPLCQCYDDTYLYSQSSGKTGHFLEIALNNVVILRQYDKGNRLDFYKGTWSKINSTTLRITMNQVMTGGTGSYTSMAPSSNDLTITGGYLVWDGDNMYPATGPEK